MKKTIKRYRGWALLTILSVFSLHAHAVFEGRDEKLQQHTTIRNEAVISPFGENNGNKATGLAPTTGDGRTDGNSLTGTEPISGSPLFVLLLGGIACGSYILCGKKKPG